MCQKAQRRKSRLVRRIQRPLTRRVPPCRYLNGTKADELFALAEDLGQKVWLDMGSCGWQEVGYFHLHRDGVDWVFVDHPSYQRQGARQLEFIVHSGMINS